MLLMLLVLLLLLLLVLLLMLEALKLGMFTLVRGDVLE